MAVDFEFHRTVLDHVDFFNELLERLGKERIFDNPDFIFDRESSGFYGAIFTVRSKNNRNSAGMWLHLEGVGIRLDIEDMCELFEWSENKIKESREQVMDFLTHIFTGYLLIEKRRGKRFVEIFNSDGHFVDWTSYNDFLHMLIGMHISRYTTERKLFLPFYPNG